MEQESQVPCFKRFALRELFDATNGFSGKCIVPGGEMQDLNLVYGGMIEGTGLVAIKRLSKLTWPDAQQFVVRILQGLIQNLSFLYYVH